MSKSRARLVMRQFSQGPKVQTAQNAESDVFESEKKVGFSERYCVRYGSIIDILLPTNCSLVSIKHVLGGINVDYDLSVAAIGVDAGASGASRDRDACGCHLPYRISQQSSGPRSAVGERIAVVR